MNIHTKTAIEAIKRSPFQAVSAIFVLSLTFFVATMVAVLVYASDKTLSYLETRPQIIAFIKDGVTSEIVSSLQNKLSTDGRIKDLRYVTKDEALEIYKNATSDNPLLAELVNPSVFPASLEFSVTDLKVAEEVILDVKSEGAVSEVGFTANIGGEKKLSDVVNRLKMMSNYTRIGGIVFVGVLAFSSFFVLLVIISMRMLARKNEIEILNLIGATPGFIKGPIILEAVIYSIIGVLSGWILALILWLYVSPSIISYFGQMSVLPKDPIMFFLLFAEILAIELFAGIIISLIGGLFAVVRSLKKVR